jgi:hypothetical protein
MEVLRPIPHWPLPDVLDLTRDGRLSTYDESVLKLSKVSFQGKCSRTGHPLKIPSPTKPARLGHFPPASQAGRLAGPVFYISSFLCFDLSLILGHPLLYSLTLLCASQYGRQNAITVVRKKALSYSLVIMGQRGKLWLDTSVQYLYNKRIRAMDRTSAQPQVKVSHCSIKLEAKILDLATYCLGVHVH